MAQAKDMGFIHKNCPKCNFDQPRRVARESWISRHIMPYLGCYPWECPMCRLHFYRRARFESEPQPARVVSYMSQQQL